MTHKTKCVLYARFSPRPADKLVNIATADQQLAACRKYAEDKGYEILGEFVDEQVSRNDKVKPQLFAATGCLRRGQVLVVAKYDRLGAGYYASGVYHFCDKRSIRIEYVDGINGETKEARLMRGCMALYAEFEQEAISSRTKDAMLYRQQNGERMSHRAPAGMKPHPTDPALWVKHPREAKVLAEVCQMYDEGLRAPTIAKKLNERGERFRGKDWDRGTIRRALIRAGKMVV